jgi:hypothetical protein
LFSPEFPLKQIDLSGLVLEPLPDWFGETKHDSSRGKARDRVVGIDRFERVPCQFKAHVIH